MLLQLLGYGQLLSFLKFYVQKIIIVRYSHKKNNPVFFRDILN